jgi:multiple sugar transport system substrate-binding protein
VHSYSLIGIFSVTLLKHIAAVLGVTCVLAVPAQAAPVNIEVWHTMTSVHKSEFEKIARRFNNEQKDVTVVLKAFPSQDALRKAGEQAVAEKRKPNLIQLPDNRSPEMIAQHKDIIPLHQLLKQYPMRDANWFVTQTTGFMRDAQGRLMAFPYMAEIPVMFYNVDGYKKAGLDSNKPARTWPELQNHLLALRDNAHYQCPFATSHQVTTHLENTAPLNGALYVTPKNGLDNVKGAQLNLLDPVFMRHLSIMVSWKRSDLFPHNSNGTAADDMFADNRCAVITTTSGALARIQTKSGLNFGVAPMPFYDQAVRTPGAPYVSGSALWATSGHNKAQDKATMAFLSFLAQPVIASSWHQRTGFLPLTDAAFRTGDAAFYDRIPGVRQLVDGMRVVKDVNSRGFRMNNYVRIEPILSREFDAALSGATPPVEALTKAVDQAKLLSQETRPAPRKGK